MRAYRILLYFVLLCNLGYAQEKAPSQKASPADSSKVTTTDGVTIDIHYSSPALKGRKIGVDVAPVGQRWRTGANETTSISFNKNVTINGKALAAGTYGLHSIPGENETILIFSKAWNQWGTKYDQKEDALRILVKSEQLSTSHERFKITAEKSGKVNLAWGNYGLGFQVKTAK